MSLLRAALLGFALLAGLGGFAHAQQVSEAAVKAAFLYRFASYVEWPESAFSPDAPFTIGVLEADQVATELDKAVAGRTIGGRRVAVRRIAEGESMRGLHMLFVGKAANAGAALRAAPYPGLLTVTETERGLEAGSAINFVLVEDRVGFEVSLVAAERHGLRISSRMLPVARRVVPRG